MFLLFRLNFISRMFAVCLQHLLCKKKNKKQKQDHEGLKVGMPVQLVQM